MFFIRALRLMVQAATAESTPRQIAWGIALGLLVGFVPKGNLLAICLLMFASALRISLPALFFSTFLFSWVAIFLDPLTDRIGFVVLTWPPLHGFWSWLYQQPFIPWTNFNHTTVMGSLLLGITLCWPCYAVLLPVIRLYGPWWLTRIERYRVSRWLFGAEWFERLRASL